MHVASRTRMLLARHPWLYWATVAVVVVIVAWSVQSRLATVDDARRRWGETRTVAVAAGPHEPGDRLAVAMTVLPVAALPADAVDDLDRLDVTVRQRLGDGEVVTERDIAPAPGPAASAASGTATVAITGQPGARPGLEVAVAADGVLIAESGRVVAVEGDHVFVAVAERDAPAVAAAAAAGLAALLYLP